MTSAIDNCLSEIGPNKFHDLCDYCIAGGCYPVAG